MSEFITPVQYVINLLNYLTKHGASVSESDAEFIYKKMKSKFSGTVYKVLTKTDVKFLIKKHLEKVAS